MGSKPNFLAVAWFTMASYKPPGSAITLGKGHYSNPGIRENKAFSLHLPSEDTLEITDYCELMKKDREIDIEEVDKARTADSPET